MFIKFVYLFVLSAVIIGLILPETECFFSLPEGAKISGKRKVWLDHEKDLETKFNYYIFSCLDSFIKVQCRKQGRRKERERERKKKEKKRKKHKRSIE